MISDDGIQGVGVYGDYFFALQSVTGSWYNIVCNSCSSRARTRSWQVVDEEICSDEAISKAKGNPKPQSFTGKVVLAYSSSVIVTFVILSLVFSINCVSSAHLSPHAIAVDVRRTYINFGMAKQFSLGKRLVGWEWTKFSRKA